MRILDAKFLHGSGHGNGLVCDEVDGRRVMRPSRSCEEQRGRKQTKFGHYVGDPLLNSAGLPRVMLGESRDSRLS
jgi:hypothetical protein